MMRRERGVALVLVLWVIALLAVIAGNFAFSMRGEAQITRNLLGTAQAQAGADAGVQRAWFELLKPATEPQRWQGNAVVHEFTLDGAVVRVSILDESGKIDLNTASGALLQGLFKSAGLSEEASAALLGAVLDWRDADNLKRLNGAEEEDYRAAGKTDAPSNAPFATVDELQRVLGMNPALYHRLAPALTVYSRQPGLNTAVAPREALLAIPGVNPALVEQFLQQREQALASGQTPPPFAGAGGFATSVGVQVYSVRSEARLADGAVFVRQAVARLTRTPKSPVAVLAWGEGDTGTTAPGNPITSN